eukprot:TRINITY_DN7744_c0_g1_i1.p1 TRINITY_DN7744_c0_g1~~TRINITY_DN7744_c0_g1_i1.p1  ORF type:complete len:588 (+),score=213.70 TRINITY_DN7744_c0_g1_i1:215-1978(+)
MQGRASEDRRRGSVGPDAAPPAANGSGGGARVAPFMEQHRSEVVRLILQALNSLGYTESAAALEQESGVLLQSAAIGAFKDGILSGEWAKVQELLPRLALGDPEAERRVTYHISRQKFLELLEAGETRAALAVLRTEVAPASDDPAALHSLTTLLAVKGKEALHRRAGWDGRAGASRANLLRTLHRHISSRLLLHEDRLCTLLQQAQAQQRERCLYLNSPPVFHTLLQDVSCDERDLPCHTQVVLRDHRDEVWHIAFSPDGRWLATAGSEGCCMLYDLAELLHADGAEEPEPPAPQQLNGHSDSVLAVAFSPNSELLLTASADRSLRCWGAGAGLSRPPDKFSGHVDAVCACCWLPDSANFLSASTDRYIYRWDLSGAVLQRWHVPRVNDLCVTPDGQRLISVDSEKQIMVYDLSVKEDYAFRPGSVRAFDPNAEDDGRLLQRDKSEPVLFMLRERDDLTSVALSLCGRYLLCSVAVKESRGCIHMYDLHQRRMVQRFRGHKQSKYVIRAVFGGAGQSFVASGSEDGRVVIYHRKTGQKIADLAGHRKIANSVAWNPADPRMLASCSDDRTVRLWTAVPVRREPPPG